MRTNEFPDQGLLRTGRVWRAVPLVLRPKMIALKNRIFRRGGLSFPDCMAACMSVVLMGGLYLCGSKTIQEWLVLSRDHELKPAFLSGTLAALFGLILLSSTVSALSSFFMGRDVDRFLASPLSPVSFLWGKTCEVGISSVWMLAIFFIPLYLAIGVSFKAGVLYFLITPILIGVFLLIAVLVGVLIAIVFASIIPARTGRNLFVVLFVLALGLLLSSLRVIPISTTDEQSFSPELTRSLVRVLGTDILPSYWVALGMRGLLTRDLLPAFLACTGLSATALALWMILRCTFRKLYTDTYSRLQGQQTPIRPVPTARRLLWLRHGLGRNRGVRALITREFFSFTRDITHTVQLAMLLAICLLYLSSLHNINAPTHVGTTTLQAWDLCAISSSLVLSSIIILSICARFVFPSVSLEGQSLWILQTAPMKSLEILQAKHLCWFLPTALISGVIFSSGGLALGLEPLLIVALCVSGIALSYGLVALGVGIGARFARFDWEHPTELSTSWGSLVYTLCGMGLVTISLLPVTIMFGLYLFFPTTFQDRNHLLVLLGGGLGGLCILNLIVSKVMLKIGSRALETLQN